MKNLRYCIVCLAFLMGTASHVYGVDKDKIFTSHGAAKLDAFHTGRALMIGETLTKPVKVSPSTAALPPLSPAVMRPSDMGRTLMQVSQWQGYSPQDFGIDMSKVNPQVADAKLLQDVTMMTAKMEFKLAGGPAAMGVTAFSLLDAGIKMYNIDKARTGQVDFTILRNIAPSAVMGAEILRGPENNKWYRTTDNFNTTFGDSIWKTNLTGTRVTEKITTSSAPGYIGKYGYDPNTDTIMTRTRMNYTERVETGGNRINPNNFLNNSYSPPPVMHAPSYTMPMPVYTPPPPVSMPSFSPSFERWR